MNYTINTVITTDDKKFTIDLTKAELDAIHKQLLEEVDEMLNKVRRKEERKSYCNTIMCDNVTVTLSVKNKNQRIQESITNLFDWSMKNYNIFQIISYK